LSAGLLLVACFLACGGGPFRTRAVYGPDLEFRAIARAGFFDEVIWTDLDGRQPVCPVVVRLPGGDVGDAEFRSVKGMKGLGGRMETVAVGEKNPKLRVTHVTLDRGGASVETIYHDDRLVSVRVRGAGEVRLAVRGKDITFPAAKEELTRTFGQPAQLIE
jgi:hypothetical protein